jgi:hypothetical protein
MASQTGEEKVSSIPSEGDFLQAFMRMQVMVEELYQDRKKGEQGSSSQVKGKEEGVGKDPPKTPPSPSTPSELDGSFHYSDDKKKKTNEKIEVNMPQLKLDIKFDLPVYNGELNAEKLDNWIRQIEVYCRIQKFTEDSTKIQLASLRLGGTALIWWERKTQEDITTKGNTISSWYEFTSALKKQFYLLGYMQQEMMD